MPVQLFPLSRSTSRGVVGDRTKKWVVWYQPWPENLHAITSSWDSWGYDNSKGGRRGGKHGRRYEDSSNLARLIQVISCPPFFVEDADVVTPPITRLPQHRCKFGFIVWRSKSYYARSCLSTCDSLLINWTGSMKCWHWYRFDRDEHGMPRRSRNHAVYNVYIIIYIYIIW